MRRGTQTRCAWSVATATLRWEQGMVCNICTGSATQTIAIGFGAIGLVVVAVIVWCCRSAQVEAIRHWPTLTAWRGRAHGQEL